MPREPAPADAWRSALLAAAIAAAIAAIVLLVDTAIQGPVRLAAAFAFASAVAWLARARGRSGSRLLATAGLLVVAGLAAWSVRRGEDIAAVIAIASLASTAIAASTFAPRNARLWIAATAATALAALALLVAAAPLRREGSGALAAVVAALCFGGATWGLCEALLGQRSERPREVSRTAPIAIAALAGMGLLVLAGWIFGSGLIVQGGTGFVPTQFNTALALVATAVALAAALRDRPVLGAVMLAFVVAQSTLTLLQEFAGLHVAIDQLFWRHAIVAEGVPPGRMAPNTALALLIGAFGAFGAWRARRAAGWWPVVWGCGLIVAAIVVLATIGFALQAMRLRAFGEHTPIALPTVLALAALAWALLALGLGHARARNLPLTLVPAALAAGAMVLSIYAWNVLGASQDAAQRTAALAASQAVSDGLRNFLRTRLSLLEHLSERLAVLPDADLERAFRGDAQRILRDFPGLFSMSWIGPDGNLRWIESPEQLERFVGTPFGSDDIRADAVARARVTGAPVITAPLALRAGGAGFAVVLPVAGAGAPRGYFAAGIRYEPLMDAMLATTALGYRVELRDGAQRIYVRDVAKPARLEVASAAEIYSRQWVAAVRPSRTLVAVGGRLPELVLAMGLLLGGLVATALRLALVSRLRASVAEAATLAQREEIAQRERAQLALENSRNELNAVLENSPDGFLLFDHDWRFLQLNPRAEEMARRPRNELIGRMLWDEFPVLAQDASAEPLRRAMSSREPVAFEIWYEPFARWFGVVAFQHPSGLALFVRDVTAQRDAYDRLRRSESALARAQRIAGLGSWELAIASEPGVVALQWSQQTYRIHGLEPGIAVATPELMRQFVHPEDRDAVDAAVSDAIERGMPLSLDHRIVRPDGVVRYVHKEGDFIVDARGKPLRLVGTLQDISARKEAEEALRLALESVQARNRELQDFAFVASHDLQEPLRKIQTFGERLADLGAMDEQGRDYIERMRHAAARMQTLIDDLLAYSRVATRGQAFVAVDLGTVAQEVVTDLESAIERAGAELHIGDLPVVQADPTQMRQLLQNLLSNSLKFRATGRTPLITVSCERFDRAAADGARRERWARLIVGDNGIGFENRHRERILQPFQRLHGRGEYEGTGIGLAIVRRIVERHGGSIAADGVPGGGATFCVELPLERVSARSSEPTTLGSAAEPGDSTRSWNNA